VAEGDYQESTWEVLGDEVVSVSGMVSVSGTQESGVYITAGVLNYDSFIICKGCIDLFNSL
jgi:hypothetical protein